MNILVVGNGWTGKKVVDELYKRGHLTSVCSHTSAIKAINNINWDWVVNCAGITGTPNVDACEAIKEETYLANAIFPLKLKEACDKNFAKFAHFSSGCIYQGEITDVNADPNYFGSTYSVSKAVSDVCLKNNSLVFRIRMPFTPVNERKNLLCKVLNYAKNGKLIDAGQNSLTDLDEAVSVACDLIEADATGPYNLVNQGSVNMHELVELLGVETQWFTPEEFKAATAASRSTCTIPAYSGMSDVKIALKNAISKLNI